MSDTDRPCTDCGHQRSEHEFLAGSVAPCIAETAPDSGAVCPCDDYCPPLLGGEIAEQPQFRPDILGGLPQSEHGGLHPELRARITAARAAIGDYELGPHPDQVAWMMQADRLAAELRSLLEFIERHSR